MSDVCPQGGHSVYKVSNIKSKAGQQHGGSITQAMVKGSLLGPRAGTKHGQQGRLAGFTEKWKPTMAFTEEWDLER